MHQVARLRNNPIRATQDSVGLIKLRIDLISVLLSVANIVLTLHEVPEHGQKRKRRDHKPMRSLDDNPLAVKTKRDSSDIK